MKTEFVAVPLDDGDLPPFNPTRHGSFPPVTERWPKPNQSLLKHGRRPPPELPGEEIFGQWHGWICAAAEMAGVPRDYVALPLLVAMAALVGNTRAVSPWSGWREPAILWGGVVGDPSTGKSPGADSVMSAVQHVQKNLAEGFDERHLEWETLVARANVARVAWEEAVKQSVKKGIEPPPFPASAVAPQEPERPRIMISDVTPERLGALLAANPKGLLHTRDELSGWLLGFDRYAKGGERSLWIEAHGGRPYTIDRVKAGGSVHVERLAISVFGGIQPDRLARLLLRGDDDGLPARFLWVWPDPIPPSRPRTSASDEFIRRAFGKLASLRSGDANGFVPVLMRLTDSAADEFEEWRIDHQKGSGGVSGMNLSARGKMPGLVLRLAMILELGAWATAPESTAEPNDVSQQAMIRAIGFVESYLKGMLDRVYGDAAAPLEERLATTLARWIAYNRPTRINVRDVRRSAGLAGLREVAAIESAAAVLVDAGWLRPDGATSGGRPRKDYLVNPHVLELMDRQDNGDGR